MNEDNSKVSLHFDIRLFARPLKCINIYEAFKRSNEHGIQYKVTSMPLSHIMYAFATPVRGD